jgi:hypothetical protein
VCCDRKLQFLFDHTKDEFFQDFQMFHEIYRRARPEQQRRFQKTFNKRKQRQSKAGE